jgi:hypothetical protein
MRFLLLLALLGSSLAQSAEITAPPEAGSAESTLAAQAAAEAWLKLIDAGEYVESWRQTAPIFQNQVPQARWEAMVGAVRVPLGAVLERKLLRADFTRSLPGVPPGEYVVLQFSTRFANQAKAVETITPMLSAGKWLVSGYYIR